MILIRTYSFLIQMLISFILPLCSKSSNVVNSAVNRYLTRHVITILLSTVSASLEDQELFWGDNSVLLCLVWNSDIHSLVAHAVWNCYFHLWHCEEVLYTNIDTHEFITQTVEL